MPERISSVYDIPDWLAEKAPGVTGPVRGLYHAARLPVDVGADMLRSGVHGALGLEEENPYQYGGERIKKINDAVSATGGMVSRATGAVSRGADSVVSALRRALVDAGAKPTEPMPAPQAKSVGSGMDFGPAAPRGALARNNPTPADFPRETQDDAGKRAQMQLAALEGELRKATSDDEALNIGKEIAALKKRFPGLTAARTSFDEQVAQAPAQAEGALGAELPDMYSGMAQANAGALAAPQAQEGGMVRTGARESLSEMYRKKVAAIEKEGKGELSKEQKGMLLMELGLKMMARSSKPGATMLGALGESGGEVVGNAQKQIETNRTREKESRREALDSAMREIGFEDKDQDNRRADRREAREEARWKESLALTKRKLDEGKWKVQNTDSGLMMLDSETGQTRPVLDAEGKPLKLSVKDSAKPAQVQLIEYLEGLPPEKRERAMKYLKEGKDKNDSDQVFEKAMALYTASAGMGGKMTMEQAMTEARRAMALARVDAAPAGGSLPAGVPPGSKQIGTSDGKPVYEAPDGKRYRVK